MALKTKYDLVYDDSIAASSTDIRTSPIVPDGRVVRVLNFGGYDPRSGDGISSFITLQFGSGSDWQTIRAGGDGFFDIKWEKGKDFTGDGIKRFRLIRQNKSTSAKIIVAWFIALIV